MRKAPAYADAWAMLSFLCGQDYAHGYELQANALEICELAAARRAVALGLPIIWRTSSLAQALACQKDYDRFGMPPSARSYSTRWTATPLPISGELSIYAGIAERGMQLVARAKQLNPNHPGWYWFADFYHAYSRGDLPRTH